MTTNSTYLSFCLLLLLLVKCVHVLFQPFPFPIISFIPNFFFFSKKIHNALWKIAHNGKNYSCRSFRHRLHILSFTETCYESFLDFENISLYTLQDTCGGPDTELKLDIMKLTCYIIQRTVFSKHRNISYEINILFGMFVSSVRSSYSHPDLLLTQQQHPTFTDHTGPQHWTFTF